MDVNIISNNTYQPVQQVQDPASLDSVQATKHEVKAEERAKLQEEVTEKVMMDLKDVQSFLYMLIGSDIKVSSGQNHVGSSINVQA